MVLELIGYAASVVIAVSLMMSSLLRLRAVNLAGSLLFALYGFAIGAIPVAVVNGFIVFVNIYYLARMLRTREFFRILEVRPGSEYLQYFLERSGPDIRRFLPSFDAAPAAALSFFVLRDVIPAGVFIGEREGDDVLRVRLDYVLPGYRDLKVGRFLFDERADFFRERGVRRLISEPGNRAHEHYLRRMGFTPAAGGLLERRVDCGSP